MPDLTLRPFTRELALAVIEGRRQEDWADGFPTDGDREVAGRIHEGAWTSPTADQPWGAWTVAAEGALVGGAGFHGPPDESGAVEIGYGIAPEWQGRGVASGAVRRLMEMARTHGARRVIASTDHDNVASQRVLERCGFVRDHDDDTEQWWSLDLLPHSGA